MASEAGAIDGVLNKELLGQCDLVIVAIHLQGTIDYIKKHAASFKKGAVVTDCCGVKQTVCEALQETAAANGFVLIGTHPMAGLEQSGFKHSTPHLFNNAYMIMTPYEATPSELVVRLQAFWQELGFAGSTVCSPAEHDRMIAFTSQLAHVVSSAFVKGRQAPKHKGFSAGSYQDMTRVARLDENMWTELLLANKQNLIPEIDALIERMGKYRDALKANRPDILKKLLQDGREIKEAIG